MNLYNTGKSALLCLLLITISLLGVLSLMRYIEKHRHKNDILVGMLIGYPPYASLAPDGTYFGFDVDIARELAARLGKKLIIKDMDLPALLIALEQHKIDIVLTNLSITPTREKTIAMIYYTGQTISTYPLAFWQTAPQQVNSLADLVQQNPTAIICVEPGSIQEEFLVSQVPSKHIRYIESLNDIIMNLKYGKVTAALLDPAVFPTLQKRSPELIALTLTLPVAFQSHGSGIGIRKNNTALIQQVRDIIAQLHANGTINRLESQWLNR